MKLIDDYIAHLRDVRRYSQRTVAIYEAALKEYRRFVSRDGEVEAEDEFASTFNVSEIRQFEVDLLGGKYPKSARTVNLYLSALSSFCRFLMQRGFLKSNPVKLVAKPKVEKRLPQFFRKDSMDEYFQVTDHLLCRDEMEAFIAEPDSESGKAYYGKLLERLIISSLYSLGIRRAELIGLRIESVDFGRNLVKVLGKGDKMREIPLLPSLSEEILLYLKAVEAMCGGKRSLKEPLFVTYKGAGLYPSYVDRSVKSALGGIRSIRGQKSPHVLRHSLATELMNEDAGLNSIKEMLGHSSLAATQVYTHSSIARLKDSYERAHPRAKNGGKNGD